MSETSRLAKSLLEQRDERFLSAHPLAESQRRLTKLMASAAPARAMRYALAWNEEDGRARLDVRFSPLPRTRLWLHAMSIGLTLLVACSAWVIVSPREESTVKWLLPIFTALAVLAMPLVVVAFASRREAEEAQLRRIVRRALLDEELPPMQRWSEED
jgi:hypothetical protein